MAEGFIWKISSWRWLLGICALWLCLGLGAQASTPSKRHLDTLNGGVAMVLDSRSMQVAGSRLPALPVAAGAEEESELLVMANVSNQVNVRQEPREDAAKVGVLYKDCGGHILEQQGDWTYIESSQMRGWVKNQYLFFGQEARALAAQVGKTLAVVEAEAAYVRGEASQAGAALGVLPRGEMVDVISQEADGWLLVDFEGQAGYVQTELARIDFAIDGGETMEQIEARRKEEAKKALQAKYGAVAADADTLLLLAALIQCEAGNEPYEGRLAVGAVVMNRVRSQAYPDSVAGVIYASGQFTPARTGKLERVYTSGKINEGCMQAAQEALNGTSNIGALTHFRRNDGRNGVVIGNHVFY